jgi:hypothetical protein
MANTALSDMIQADLAAITQGKGGHSMARAMQGKPQHIMPMNNDRAMYEYLRSVYPKDVIITDGFLRSVVPFTNEAVEQITFVMTKNDNGASNVTMNNLLDQSDTFETLYFRMGLFTLPTTAPGNNTFANGTTYSNAVFQWSANPLVFIDQPGGQPTEANALNSIYNGYLYIKIGSTVFYEQFPTSKFRHVGQAQQGVAVSVAPVQGVTPESSIDFDKTKQGVIPTLMIDGSGKNVFQIETFDGFNGSPQVTNRTNYIFLEAIGFKCQDGAKQQTKKFRYDHKAAA